MYSSALRRLLVLLDITTKYIFDFSGTPADCSATAGVPVLSVRCVGYSGMQSVEAVRMAVFIITVI